MSLRYLSKKFEELLNAKIYKEYLILEGLGRKSSKIDLVRS